MAGARRPRGGGARPRPNNQGIPMLRPMPRPMPQQGMGGGFGPQQNWSQRGFESRGAAQSVGRQYGLVRNDAGDWVKPDMNFLERQVDPWTHNVYGNSTPVGIGGARWMVGPQGAQFTGQASDVPFGNMPLGQAYNAPMQTPYAPQGGGRRRRTQIGGGIY